MKLIFLLFLFLLIPLANYVLGRMRRRYESPTPDSRPVPDMGMRRQAAPPTPSSVRERAPEARPGGAIHAPPSPVLRRRHFTIRGDLRRAIISMTILGPCRAEKPADDS